MSTAYLTALDSQCKYALHYNCITLFLYEQWRWFYHKISIITHWHYFLVTLYFCQSLVIHRSVDCFHLHTTKTMYLMWYYYIYSFIYLYNDITYTTVYRFIKKEKKVIIENSDIIHYRSFIYICETWSSIYSNYRIIEIDILNKLSKK
jgi:hypothetical protein